MYEPEFNLLDEPWIRLMKSDCTVQEVSLKDALIRAHEFKDFCGELPTQDVAVLRLLLAVLHTVFSRVDEHGDEAPLISASDAMARWKSLWSIGQLPEEPIESYLGQWHDRFWLFHEICPFWQVPEASKGTAYTAAKLNGNLSESSNKVRLFPSRAGGIKTELTYPEAARWLLYVNAFDDTSAKPKGKGLPSPGVGWLGKLGLIYAGGQNVFETLLLNLTLLKDGSELWSEDNRPVWELESPRSAERVEIVMPDNPAALLTLQSRRLLLCRDRGKVTGFSLLGGDFFQRENAFAEQMTVWSSNRAKEHEPPLYLPRRHDPARQMWRDFGSLFMQDPQGHQPGVVRWYNNLTKLMAWQKQLLTTFRIASVQYGDKDFFITDTYGDAVTLHAGLVSEMGRAWQQWVRDEIERCEELAYQIGWFAESLAKAAGGDNGKQVAEKTREQFFARIDRPFRHWLAAIEPDDSADQEDQEKQAEQMRQQWRQTAQKMAMQYGAELIRQEGTTAFVGREVKEKIKGKEVSVFYCAPEAYERLKWHIYQIYR